MKTTLSFEEHVLRKRPYIERAWCMAAIANPMAQVTQIDGRKRFWIDVDCGDSVRRLLGVVTLADGETVHNAFFDRGFQQA